MYFAPPLSNARGSLWYVPLSVCVHVAAATVQMAKHALSNLLGGITHFHGRPVVQMSPTSQPYEPEERSLVTGVPSRSFFPR